MLVLTRKLNEDIIVDGNIRVQILGIQGGRIRIGITAPEHVSIRRGELHPESYGEHVIEMSVAHH